MPALILLAILLGVPLLEIAVFIQVGGVIGLWPTLVLVIATAIAGAAVLRWQGLATVRRAQASLERGELPLAEVFDGACLLVAGVLLLTPGFVTDSVGALLFVPPVRAGLRRFLGRFFRPVEVGAPGRRPPAPGVIDVDYHEVRDDDDEDGRGSPWRRL